MQFASCFLIAIKAPLTENARGSLKSGLYINSISSPGVKPTSRMRLADGWSLSISIILAFSPTFNWLALLNSDEINYFLWYESFQGNDRNALCLCMLQKPEACARQD